MSQPTESRAFTLDQGFTSRPLTATSQAQLEGTLLLHVSPPAARALCRAWEGQRAGYGLCVLEAR